MSAKVPSSVDQNGRRYFWRSEVERYKKELAGLPFQNDRNTPDVLIPAKLFAMELGVCVRTLGRRIAESRNAAAA
jgi:hypothetical protein